MNKEFSGDFEGLANSPSFPPIDGFGEQDVFWTFDMAEDALIAARDLWRRSPRAGHGPLKSSWPNELVQRIEGGDYDARGGDMKADAAPMLSLSRREIAKRDYVSGWLELVPGDLNRRIVNLVIGQKAAGRSQISWTAISRKLQHRGRNLALSSRYNSAISAICISLNHPDIAAMIKSGQKPKEIAAATGLGFAEVYAMQRRLQR